MPHIWTIVILSIYAYFTEVNSFNIDKLNAKLVSGKQNSWFGFSVTFSFENISNEQHFRYYA